MDRRGRVQRLRFLAGVRQEGGLSGSVDESWSAQARSADRHRDPGKHDEIQKLSGPPYPLDSIRGPEHPVVDGERALPRPLRSLDSWLYTNERKYSHSRMRRVATVACWRMFCPPSCGPLRVKQRRKRKMSSDILRELRATLNKLFITSPKRGVCLLQYSLLIARQ